jgi:glycosyltransferase involved in cell wall biosynthesis
VTDLVVLSLEAWDQVWRRNQHLVAGLLRTDPTLRVLFVEPAADPVYAAIADRAFPRLGAGLRPGPHLPGIDTGRLWLLQPTKWLPRRVDRWADRRWAATVRRAVARIGWRAPRLWVNDLTGMALLDATTWPALYDVTDDWLLAERGAREHERLVRLERSLLAQADEVVVCSPTLVESKGRLRPVTLIPNAVDVAAYHGVTDRPADLPAGPVALYAGTVHRDRIDLHLTVATAGAIGDQARLVLLGPAPLSAADLAELAGAGVVVLGARPAADVPAYLRHADVLVVPHVLTPFTESLDPIKRYEYRAAGRPVVATAVAGFVDSGMPRLTVASSADFPAAVAGALAQAPPRSAPLPPVDADVPDWAIRVVDLHNVLKRLGAESVRHRR